MFSGASNVVDPFVVPWQAYTFSKLYAEVTPPEYEVQ